MSKVLIVGAGPAGASLALLLARAGIDVVLLERQRDFDREFRGEVLMPSGLDACAQMGLAPTVAELPGQRQEQLEVVLNKRSVLNVALARADEERPANTIRAVSQPALLEMLLGQASEYPTFEFWRGASLRELLRSADGRITGARVRMGRGRDSERDCAADLVVGTDGRNSAVRKQLGVTRRSASPPMDIVWCKIPLPPGFCGMKLYLGRGHLLVAYHTWGNMLQLGWVILKGHFGELRAQGMPQWLEEMANQVTPELATSLRRHRDSVERPFLLDVVSDCVERWSAPGCLLLGDAAHTMSPVGGQGINVALRDALVCSNHLIPVLMAPAVNKNRLDQALLAIEVERLPEIERIQRLQAMPPRLVLAREWWGEPLRRSVAWLAQRSLVQRLALRQVQSFLNGVTSVRLHDAPG